jgi:transcriptional regulator with XRE-family HTH domain
MVKFESDHLDMFLSVVRKYMQLRGGLSQKDLAEKIDVGISTMSRFLNQKTKEIDPQLIAAIVARLNIPLHEIIDFVSEDSTSLFKKMVTLYKDNESTDEEEKPSASEDSEFESFEESLDNDKSQTRTKTTATIRGTKIPFGEREQERRQGFKSTGEKLSELTARQKGFLSEFLDLDMDGKDLVVSAGEVIIKYLNRKQFEL